MDDSFVGALPRESHFEALHGAIGGGMQRLCIGGELECGTVLAWSLAGLDFADRGPAQIASPVHHAVKSPYPCVEDIFDLVPARA
jgi:hypothetical protein